MAKTNDEKAIDQNYKSSIELLGKKRLLGRTNKRIIIELRRLVQKEQLLDRILDEEMFEKAYAEWENELNKIVKTIITPISKEELKELEIDDISAILREISRRNYRRRGFTNEEIQELETADKNVILEQAKQINAGDSDFLTQNTDSDMNTGKQNSLEI